VNYRASIVLGALLALGVVACDPDPYDDDTGGTATLLGALLTNGTTPAEDLVPADGLTVTGVPLDPEEEEPQTVLHVLTTAALDGASIQTTVNDCTPKDGWLTVTGPAITCETGTPAWYSCYQPASPSPDQGGSVVIFQACEPIAGGVGWYNVAGLVEGATYTASGTIRDATGAELPINVTFTAAPAFVAAP
jgi:hypothetical protein